MRVAASQSNYIPWKGYFDLINSADIFVFYDDVQYTNRDWRNRNILKTPYGPKWLTIPCGSNTNRLICEVELTDSEWQKNHWGAIRTNYGKTKYFGQYKDIFQEIYLKKNWLNLSDFNQHLIKIIAGILEIKTKFEDSRKYNLDGTKEFRIRDLLEKINADTYVCGPSAQSYLKPEYLKGINVDLEWMDYSGYKEYHQLFPPFVHQVTILDLIFNEGPNSKYYLKTFAPDE